MSTDESPNFGNMRCMICEAVDLVATQAESFVPLHALSSMDAWKLLVVMVWEISLQVDDNDMLVLSKGRFGIHRY